MSLYYSHLQSIFQKRERFLEDLSASSSSFALCLLWKNRAIGLSPPNCYAPHRGDSFIPSGKPVICLFPSTVLLHVSLGRPILLLSLSAQVRALRGFLLVVHTHCMPYPAPPPSLYLLTDGASPRSSPHFFVGNPHRQIYL